MLDALELDFDVHAEWADTGRDVARLARAASDAGVDVVIAMGGDGVVHHAANGLVGTGTPLGILPAGTTNVVAKILRIPNAAHRAAQAMAGFTAASHTLARIRAETPGGTVDRHAVFAVGVGFDADVVEVAEQRPYSKLSFGSLHYARSAASQLFGRYRSQRPFLTASCGGTAVPAVAVLVQIHGLYTYFGKLPLYLSPGYGPGLTAAAVERLTPTAALAIARRSVTKRSLAGAPGCTLFQNFDSLAIAADGLAPFQADGELLGAATSIRITPAPAAVRILSPA